MALVLQAEPLEPLEEDELLEAFDDDVAEDFFGFVYSLHCLVLPFALHRNVSGGSLLLG